MTGITGIPFGDVPDSADWPDVLVGPLLRRVTRSSVSVFLACRGPRELRLHIYGPTDADDYASEWVTTSEIGIFLHVAVVTLRLPPGTTLHSNTWYAYDIEVQAGTWSVVSAEGSSIAYRVHRGTLRPGFFSPPEDVTTLRVVHASCRLPHGDSADALPSLDRLLQRALETGTGTPYPHHLIFHGDQIYADDVSPAMLYMARKVGNSALGWRIPEVLPNAGKLTSSDSILFDPTLRTAVLSLEGAFTTTNGDSHLLTLSEFLGMYMLVWSDLLWPKDAVPSDDHVFPQESWAEAWSMSLEGNGRTVRYERSRASAIEKYDKTIAQIYNFSRGLKSVRRALANLPTLMCFDDHEVTDDWMLNRSWQTGLASSSLAQRMVTNALAAYAVFQQWGNSPEQFAKPSQEHASSTPGRDLLDGIYDWTSGMRLSGVDRYNAPSPPEKLTKAIGLPRLLGHADQPSLCWNYRVDLDNYEFVFLDTRTRRDFPASDDGAPALLAASEISQVAPSQSKVGIIVSPAPILGHSFMENILQPGIRWCGKVPVVGPAVETLLGTNSAASADYEAWAFNEAALSSILRELGAHGQVCVLSGDVHYSFCAVASYYDRQGRAGEIVQLTSSPLCNYNDKPRLLAIASSIIEEFSDENAIPSLAKLGMAAPALLVAAETAEIWVPIALTHMLAELVQDAITGDGPQWAAGIQLQRDPRDLDLRNAVSGVTPVSLGTGVSRAKGVAQRADRKLNLEELEISRTVVSRNAFCELIFTDHSILHRVHFNPFPEETFHAVLPYTQVEIPTTKVPP